MRALFFPVILAALAWVPAAAADHEGLAKMYEADQRERREGPEQARCLVGGACDKERRDATLELLKAGEVRTANDYVHAAMIFQHGTTAEDAQLAHGLATIAATIDPGLASARWLAAAAWDRTLMRRNKPQWYGTQFTKRGAGKWELYPVDESAVSDDERRKLGLPTLAEARENVRRMNEP